MVLETTDERVRLQNGEGSGWAVRSRNTLSFTMLNLSSPLARYPRGGGVQICVEQQNWVCESEAGAESSCLDWGHKSESHHI